MAASVFMVFCEATRKRAILSTWTLLECSPDFALVHTVSHYEFLQQLLAGEVTGSLSTIIKLKT